MEFVAEKLGADTMMLVACKAEGLKEKDEYTSIGVVIGNTQALATAVANALAGNPPLDLFVMQALGKGILQKLGLDNPMKGGENE